MSLRAVFMWDVAGVCNLFRFISISIYIYVCDILGVSKTHQMKVFLFGFSGSIYRVCVDVLVRLLVS